jgi:hypothetical protein
MKTTSQKISLIAVILIASSWVYGGSEKERTLSVEEYRSKMKAGWLGQMAGVGWGFPTEFDFTGKYLSESDVPQWTQDMLNQPFQDDVYVEMTFLKTLADFGFEVSIRQAGIDFANSRYGLAHANRAGRDNLRKGTAPPYSGHPRYNSHADDIDYQIEADYSGLIAPGMSQIVIDLGETFGQLMNYGDGVYGGQFVGGMYAEAYFETDMHKIIEAGLACIPKESKYAETIRDVIGWYKVHPDDWIKTWQLVEDKYNLNPENRAFSCHYEDGKPKAPKNENDYYNNIDAKMNGAYIAMGLLYGEGDMDKTIIISMRCGQDSDCNPSNAAGILATSLGMENLPQKYKTGIDNVTYFSHTAYNFPKLLAVCEKLTREAVTRSGGRIKTVDSEEVFVIPKQSPRLQPLEQSWEATPIGEDVDVYFTEAEFGRISNEFKRRGDVVTSWQISKPFFKAGIRRADLLNVKFAPERNPKFNEWTKVKGDAIEMPDGIVDFLDIVEGNVKEHCVVYLKTDVWVDAKTSVIIECGSDDGIKLWINGSMIHQNNAERHVEFGNDTVIATLNKGWNRLMMKVTQGIGDWGACMNIKSAEYEKIKGLKFRN